MNTPFEDLEYLSDYLPDEGESVIVTRRGGELICQPMQGDTYREGVGDSELYGRLVIANEHLSRLAVVPLWTSLFVAFAAAVAFYQLSGVGWEGWYVALAIGASGLLAGMSWVSRRRRQVFETDIRLMLDSQMRRRSLNRFALIGAIRQHPELATLLDEISRHFYAPPPPVRERTQSPS